MMNRSEAAAWALAAGLTFGLAGCASQRNVLQAGPAGPAGPDARQCDARIENQAPLVDVFRDDRATTLTVSNDGGWCGTYIRLMQVTWVVDWREGAIYQPPMHGTVRLRTTGGVGSVMHVEYRANPSYVGADAFAVQLEPGFSIRRTTVQAVAGGAAGGPRTEVGITSSLGDDFRRSPER